MTALTPPTTDIWSKEILFQAMPVLRFEQFEIKKASDAVLEFQFQELERMWNDEYRGTSFDDRED